MDRRKFLTGLGSLAAGSAAIVGSGAYTSLVADRSATMKVKSDVNAFMELHPLSDVASIGGTNGRTLQVKLRLLNDDAITRFDPVFEIQNSGKVAHDNDDYEFWMAVNPGNNASGLNEDSAGNRVVRFDWNDNGTWRPLNRTDNTKPGNLPVLGSGDAVEVRLTVDLREFEPDGGVGYGDDYKLLKQAIVHGEEV